MRRKWTEESLAAFDVERRRYMTGTDAVYNVKASF